MTLLITLYVLSVCVCVCIVVCVCCVCTCVCTSVHGVVCAVYVYLITC